MKGKLLLILVLSLGLTEAECGSYRVMQDWELPRQYHGWVLMERANRKCPPAVSTFSSVTLKVNSAGQGCTSTPIFKRPQYVRVFEMDSLGHRHELRMGSPGNGGQIWGFSNAAEGNESVFFYATEFFVGTEAEYQSSRENTSQVVVGA